MSVQSRADSPCDRCRPLDRMCSKSPLPRSINQPNSRLLKRCHMASLLSLLFATLVNFSPTCHLSSVSLSPSSPLPPLFIWLLCLCPLLSSFPSSSSVWTHRCTRTRTSQLALLPPIFQGQTCAGVRALPSLCLLPTHTFASATCFSPVSAPFNLMCGDQYSSSRTKDEENHLLSWLTWYFLVTSMWTALCVWYCWSYWTANSKTQQWLLKNPHHSTQCQLWLRPRLTCSCWLPLQTTNLQN